MAHMKSTKKIIDNFKKRDYIHEHADEDHAMPMPLNLETTVHHHHHHHHHHDDQNDAGLQGLSSAEGIVGSSTSPTSALRSTSSSNTSTGSSSTTSSSSTSTSSSMPRVFKTYSSHR